ncbi:hypothetical protein FACS189421_00340 [Bacteroidia bacterium]|nr:hypothetical protein FACS189421_00340 [Bacteroidia bacterium]GHT47491.1 hypothetical protein FACS189440_08170 [Bacteroidia bacterium]
MKKRLLLFMLLGFSLFSYSQERKIKVSLQGGFLHGGAIYDNEPEAAGIEGEGGWNAGVDISYFITKHFFVSAHINEGEFYYLSYYMDPISDTYYRKEDKVTGIMNIQNIGLLAGYCLSVSPSVNLTGQIGFAQFIQRDQYPTVKYFPDERFADNIYPEYSSDNFFFYSASFPVKFSVGVTPFRKLNIGVAKNIEIGYAVGFYIEPDFGFFTGVYHGPQLSVSF